MDNKELFDRLVEQVKGFDQEEGTGQDSVIFISSLVRRRADALNESEVQACIKGDVNVMVDMLVASAQTSPIFQRALITATRDLLSNNKKFKIEAVESNENVFLAEPIQGTTE